MCGICGTIGFRGKGVERAHVEKMVAMLNHRGPDEQNCYIDDTAALGHARLMVIDLTTGRQPLCNERGNLWITYNGEIFNYIELRGLLKSKGHRFKTNSDTEVIVHGYEEYGTEFFSMMIGQWAFALWDTKRRELLLCRDRVGICPLYYVQCGDRVLFASEIKAIFTDPEIRREFDYRGLAEVFTFWTTVPPQTVFKGVRELPPGHWIRFSEGRTIEGIYWQLVFPQHFIEDRETAASCARKLRHTLSEATRLRFTRSDVPVAAYLSGGIDSSITALLIKQHTDTVLNTFSIRFSEEEYDEGRFQELMVRQLDTIHQEVRVPPSLIGEVFPMVVWHAEKPLLRTAPAPMFLLSKAVSDAGFKVVVTGEGADEMLGGYDIFRQALVRSFLARGGSSSRRAEIIGLLYPWLKRSPGSTPAFARQFFSQSLSETDTAHSHRIRWQSASALFRLFSEDVRREMEKYRVTEDFLNRMPSNHREWHPLALAQWIEINSLLTGYLLGSQGDRMLMAHGVEGRFPFLDVRLMEQSETMPPRYKIMGLDEKYILKYAFKNQIPRKILRRSKQPYRAPDASSFFSAPMGWIDDYINPAAVKQAGLFDPNGVDHLFKKCRKKRGVDMSNNDNMAVVGVFSTMLLYRQFIESPLVKPTQGEFPKAG